MSQKHHFYVYLKKGEKDIDHKKEGRFLRWLPETRSWRINNRHFLEGDEPKDILISPFLFSQNAKN